MRAVSILSPNPLEGSKSQCFPKYQTAITYNCYMAICQCGQVVSWEMWFSNLVHLAPGGLRNAPHVTRYEKPLFHIWSISLCSIHEIASWCGYPHLNCMCVFGFRSFNKIFGFYSESHGSILFIWKYIHVRVRCLLYCVEFSLLSLSLSSLCMRSVLHKNKYCLPRPLWRFLWV